jgi:hypothetical protein
MAMKVFQSGRKTPELFEDGVSRGDLVIDRYRPRLVARKDTGLL